MTLDTPRAGAPRSTSPSTAARGIALPMLAPDVGLIRLEPPFLSDPPLAWPSPPEPGAVLPPRPPEVRPWTGVRRRLAVRLDAAGDLLMTTPAIRALRARSADEWLAVLTSSAGAEVARLLPEVDEVIVYDPPWTPRGDDEAAGDAGVDLAIVERLRAGGFDGAAIFTVHSQSALPAGLLCHLAGIPRRLAHAVETPYGLLTDWVPEPERDAPRRHETRRQLDLLAAVGIEPDEEHLSLHVPATAAVQMRERLDGLGLGGGRPFVVVHPGANAESRRYPPDLLAAVVRGLADRGLPVVLTGSRAEAPLVDTVSRMAGVPTTSLAGSLGFGDLAALLALAPVLVAGNTAVVHLAAAVGTPVVVAYAGTNSQHLPWRVRARVLTAEVACRGCRRSRCPLGHGRCLAQIPPASIVAATLEVLDAPVGGAGG